MKTPNCRHCQAFAKFLQFKNICISLSYIENHVKLLYFSVFRVFEKTYNFLFFIRKGESSVETFPQKSARMGKETGRKPERTEGGKGRTAERGSTGPPFPLPFYFLYIQLHRMTKRATQWT